MRIFFFFLLFLASFELAAQDAVRINGLVSDARTGTALEYAHIGIAGSTVGTVSNSLGVFSLIIPQRFSSQQLSVSYIGYETFTIPIASIGEGEQEIKLIPTAISLAEIVILGGCPGWRIHLVSKFQPKQLTLLRVMANLT